MSGGIEMESRVRGGGGGGEQQQSGVGGEKAVLKKLISSTSNNKDVVVASNNLHGERTTKNQNHNSSNGNPSKKQHRRLRRRENQQAHRKQMNQSNNFHGKRIRRNTQPAPNNTNEFLMQEHDHLFHLDFENEEWEGQQQLSRGTNGDDLYSHHYPHQHTSSGGTTTTGGAFYSSSEEDQDYLSREFSATYDIVNAERLSSMTKTELISEYQMLQERVESLERKLKTGTGYNNSIDKNTGSPNGNDEDPENSSRVKCVREEVLQLRKENLQIKARNEYLLKRLTLNAQGKEEGVGVDDMEEEMEADQGSTDSGCGGGSAG